MHRIVVVAFLALGLTPPAPQAQEKPEPLTSMNQVFRKAHAQARTAMLSKAEPIILVDGDDLVLLHKGKRHPARVVPEAYHTLKAIAHGPIAIHLLLAPYGEAKIDDRRVDELRRLRQLALEAEDAPALRALPAKTLARQIKMLTAMREFLDPILDKKECRKDDEIQFARRMTPLVMANARAAAQAQLEGLHKQMLLWKKELTSAEWQRLRVVIMGSAMPRKGNLAAQYFARLLEEKGEGLRILYAESLYDEGRALNLLGVSLVDSGIAVAFFDDPLRMHRDLLEDVAREILKEMFPD